MEKIKKKFSIMLSFIFIFTFIQMPLLTLAKGKSDEKVYIKLRLNRKDIDYEGWNFWVWELNKDGRRVDFIGEDNDGKFTVVETTKGAEKLGIIARKSVEGNDWAINYTGDILVDLNDGDKEVVITYKDLSEKEDASFKEENHREIQGNNEDNTEIDIIKNNTEENIELGEIDSESKDIIYEVESSAAKEEIESSNIYEIKDLDRDFENVKLNLHYYRFDESYDNWDVWSWLDGIKGGEGYDFTSDDSYGKIATINYENVINADERGIGVIIRRPDWSNKDIETDRFINLAYANNDGVINAYFVQNNEEIVFREEDAITNPGFISAKIDSLNKVKFTLNSKLSEEDIKNIKSKIKITEGEKEKFIEIDSIKINEDLLSGIITTKVDLDITKIYTLEMEGFSDMEITLGKIYESEEFKNLYHYDGELGSIYSKDLTKFVLWAPTAKEVQLALFNTGDYNLEKSPKEVISMIKGENGIWYYEAKGNLKGTYYTYLVNNTGEVKEVTDPYAKAVGVNGIRAMVVNLSDTNPKDWENDTKPELTDATDSIIYEMHIRDFTIDESSGVSLGVSGKYNGVWEEGTTLFGNGDIKTGVDHLVELGITHLHLLPTFDHRSIDETKLDEAQYNWGYDPQNYNVPEGSYSSNPYEAEVRIEEFKTMVMELHKAGIRVVMDVVYNHTGLTSDSHLNLAVPNYYYRQNAEGGFSNGSGCGNELASERSMVRKMMVDSVSFWAKEYHIDGFRFDLMGLHDINTMKEIREELNKIDESIIVYGEGWTGGDSPLSDSEKSTKLNTLKYGEFQIAAFSDDMRDGIKGHVFETTTPGFINGYRGLEEMIKFGVVASVNHPQIKYGINPTPYEGYSTAYWANEPYQTVNYASAHDNLTLWDKLQSTKEEATEEELKAMNKMSAAIVLTSQGIPFFQGGEEFLRTKQYEDGSFEENSYNKPDSINAIDWTRKETYNDVFNYYKGLIELRKSHKAFRMNSSIDIQEGVNFLEKGTNFKGENIVAYTIDGTIVNDAWKTVSVIFNANSEDVEVTLPKEEWVVVVNGESAGTQNLGEINGNKVIVPKNTSYVLVDKESFKGEGVTPPTEDNKNEDTKPEDDNNAFNSDTNGDNSGNENNDNKVENNGDSQNTTKNNKPVISAIDKKISIGETFNEKEALKGVTAHDTEDGDITANIKIIENTVNSQRIGKYKVTYEVADSNGNKITKTINVTVQDKKLVHTGGVPVEIIGIIGLAMIGIGSILFIRKKKGIN
ncbi:MAG: type I pullulanase [Clostridium perfringens]|nr:type I pullulanase [Clostridium perfringens]